MAIRERIQLCIWAWRLPAASLDEMLDSAKEADEFYRMVANTTPVKPVVTTHRIQPRRTIIRDFTPIEWDEWED